MTRPFMRQVVDSLLPDGAIWRPAHGGDFDRLLNAVAESKQEVLDGLESLKHIRNPYKCPAELLPDLEREFGIAPNDALAERQRRQSLAATRYKLNTLSTAQKLQYALDKAGFGLRVTPNSPPIDPETVGWYYVMQAHDFPSIYCAGNTSVAYCGYYNAGYYLASGGEETMETPPEPYWPLVFFVGGSVVRNAGRIARIAVKDIPEGRKHELHRLILRIKPLGIWAALLVRYV